MKNSTESVQIDPPSKGHGSPDILKPDVTLILFTWITFFILLAVLYKFAWKPILAGLDQREDTIRRSLDEAEKTHQEFEKIDQTRQQMILEAEEKAKNLLNNSRKAAHNASRVITEKTREETLIMLENTKREVKAEFEKAERKLRQESAETAIALAGQLIEENLDDKKNRRLVENLIKKI